MTKNNITATKKEDKNIINNGDILSYAQLDILLSKAVYSHLEKMYSKIGDKHTLNMLRNKNNIQDDIKSMLYVMLYDNAIQGVAIQADNTYIINNINELLKSCSSYINKFLNGQIELLNGYSIGEKGSHIDHSTKKRNAYEDSQIYCNSILEALKLNSLDFLQNYNDIVDRIKHGYYPKNKGLASLTDDEQYIIDLIFLGYSKAKIQKEIGYSAAQLKIALQHIKLTCNYIFPNGFNSILK